MSPAVRRSLAWGGIAGPVGFVAAWSSGGLATAGYSPVHDAISRLAARGAPTRALMSAGFVCFGVALPAYSLALRERLPGPAWAAAATTGIATLGVAAFPLGVSHTGDTVHGGFATAGYVSLAAIPLFAARPLAASGRRRAAQASLAVGLVSGALLAATVTGPAHGLFQRAGLTIGDVWVVASAVVVLRGGVAGPITPAR